MDDLVKMFAETPASGGAPEPLDEGSHVLTPVSYAGVKEDQRPEKQGSFSCGLLLVNQSDDEAQGAWKNYRLDDRKSIGFFKRDMTRLGVPLPQLEAASTRDELFAAVDKALADVVQRAPKVDADVTHNLGEEDARTGQPRVFCNIRIHGLVDESEAGKGSW
jgi:hypothetical protein